MEHVDSYSSYFELRESEQEGTDFAVVMHEGTSGLVIVAPHGGKIETHTSAIAIAIAGDDHSLYLFEGKKNAKNKSLHITSENFDEPRAVALVTASSMAVGVHGADGLDESVIVGGGNAHARARMLEALQEFAATDQGPPYLLGRSPKNICNRAAMAGIQLEISRGLRNRLAGGASKVPNYQDKSFLNRFVICVRSALKEGPLRPFA